MTNPFASLDATAQADLVRSGAATPTDLVDAAIAAVEAVNPELNAVIHPRFEQARAEAASVDPAAPFPGVPLVLKDLDGTLAGAPYHAGTAHLRDAGYVADSSAWLFERLQAAGFVVIGKTNTPEFGLLPTTEPVAHGPTRNPWNLGHSTGGSSGGSAAAVASGMVPVGHAGDGGGSIRIPASACGLVGLKPSRGRVPLGPEVAEAWGGLVARLVVSRSVRDTAAILDAVAGPGVGDPYWAPPPSRSYVSELAASPARLRIGVTTQTSDGVPCAPEVITAVERTAALLAELGHEVTDVAPPQIGDEAFFAEMSGHFLMAYPAWVAQDVDHIGRLTGTPVVEGSVEPMTWALAEAGRAVGAVAFLDAVAGLHRLSRSVIAWWSEHDVLLTPTLPDPPLPLGSFAAEPENPMAGLFAATRVVTFTMPFNITGQPAMSLPLGVSSAGLPIGVQLVGGPAREDVLIMLAAQVESVAPWADRRPSVWAG